MKRDWLRGRNNNFSLPLFFFLSLFSLSLSLSVFCYNIRWPRCPCISLPHLHKSRSSKTCVKRAEVMNGNESGRRERGNNDFFLSFYFHTTFPLIHFLLPPRIERTTSQACSLISSFILSLFLSLSLSSSLSVSVFLLTCPARITGRRRMMMIVFFLSLPHFHSPFIQLFSYSLPLLFLLSFFFSPSLFCFSSQPYTLEAGYDCPDLLR